MLNEQNEAVIPEAKYTIDALKELGYTDWQIIQAESNDNAILKLLDRYCGIDFLLQNSTGIFGLSSRVRYANPNTLRIYPDFTLRCDKFDGIASEMTKRKKSISNGSMYPYYTAQIWVVEEQGVLLAGGIVKTTELYDFIDKNPSKVKMAYSDREFMCVNWNDVMAAGYKSCKVVNHLI